MPTYQYACVDCGEPLEVVQKFTDDPLTVCPTCSGRLRKVFSAVGVVFKGSGFYRTDSRAGQGSSERSGSNGDGKSSESASGDAKSGAGKSGDGASGNGSTSKASADGKSSSSTSGSNGSSSGSGSSAKKKSAESAA